ncbi:hypothetical protein EST38_g10385 [Candolleomyces aberdarensis]|uniref:Uncharacterized protein n=1 Tax=Candolleomyces aberdarensis TaxID=2316362 RepID=A0A4Q2DAR7_9AGAR|nr:hypothetical protein EST38_g10385 [Candolleomyces aberdarensis]
MDYDEKIIRITPSYLFANPRSLQAETRYHTKTVAALADEHERVQSPKAKRTWLEEKKRFWRDRMKHVTACNDALNLEGRKQEVRRQKIRERVVERIKEKSTELGWGREAERYFKENPMINFVHLNPTLTNDEWTKIEPDLIPLMEKERELFRQQEIGEHIRQRINKWLKPAHTALILSQPPNELNPSILDLSLSDEWRTHLCTEAFNEDLTESLVEAASAQIPEIAKAWRKDRIEQLLEVVRNSKTYSGQEVTEDILHLSSTIFRCTKCEDYYGHGGVHTFPHTLVHACNHPHDLPIIQFAPRHLPAPPPPNYGPYEADRRFDPDPVIRLYRKEEMHVVAALKYAGMWSGLNHIVFDDAAHEHMLTMLDTLGWSRETSAAEMEERQPYVECLCECYHNPAERASRKIFRWKKAPHPPGLKGHPGKIRVLASEERWLHYEKSVPLEEEGVEDHQTRGRNVDSDSGSEIIEDLSDLDSDFE